MMDKHAIWKWLILIVLVSGSIALITPPGKKIRLGLDLKGGTSFTVAVDEQKIRDGIRADLPESATDTEVDAQVRKVLDGAQARALEVLRNRVDSLGISEPIIYPGKDNRIIIQLPGIDESKRKQAEESIRSVAFLEFRLAHKRNAELVDQLFVKGVAPTGYKIVRSGNATYYAKDGTVSDEKMDAAFRQRLARFEAPDTEYEFMLEKADEGASKLFRPCFVRRRAEMTGEYVSSAQVDYQALGQPVVEVSFDGKGTKKFAALTADYAPGGAKNPDRNKYRQLAIVLDGTLYSAPRLNEPIPNGRAQISGSFTLPEATMLANILNAGSLPAPVKIEERRVVDPSLGADSIRSGISSGLYGCLAIIVLMAFYYLACGLIADIALILNIVLLPIGAIIVAGFLDAFSGSFRTGSAVALPVLTLPGIAGIALTIGMAVDANVLIFERIREEIRAGKGLVAAISAGYDRAFTAIFDSNMTTIITAIILFLLGSGPVRGYAVTLTAGLIVSLYTAVVVTKMCFTAIASKTQNPNLVKMFSLFKTTNIDFMGQWKLFLSASAVIIIVTWTLMVGRGLKDPTQVFGVDFTGGSSLTLGVKEKPSVEDVRAALDAVGLKDATIQYQGAMQGGSEDLLEIKTGGKGEESGKLIEKTLVETFPKAGFMVKQADDVGPQIGRELKTKALWAMLASLLAMVIYISWRFEFGFALGALVSLFHDVLITAGICHLAGFQLNMTVVAALMTIVGYSVNDTIVIFDRIRENLRSTQNRSFVEVCNLSMNQTLARTLLTNLMTFVSVLSLLIFGGGAIKDFAFAMFIGMVAGTYSTMYIATPVVLLWYRFKTPDMGRKKVVVSK